MRAASSATRSSHAYGAAFDNPDLIVACVVGDGEAETGPLAAVWHSNKFLNPARDGAVLPILHLNGYKIANPTVLARMRRRGARRACSAATATSRYFVEGGEPDEMHQQMADALDTAFDEIRAIQERRSRRATASRAAALADDRAAQPEGLDGAEGGRRQEGRGLLALASGAGRRTRRETRRICKLLEDWMRSYEPEELFDEARQAACPNSQRLRPTANRRMGANPHANGGLLLRELKLPDFRDYAVEVAAARRSHGRSDARDWASSCAT